MAMFCCFIWPPRSAVMASRARKLACFFGIASIGLARFESGLAAPPLAKKIIFTFLSYDEMQERNLVNSI